MPTIAIPLSLLGLVPFVVFAGGAVGQNPQTAEHLLFALIDYAALILAFAGGVHWGLALLPGVGAAVAAPDRRGVSDDRRPGSRWCWRNCWRRGLPWRC